jgi:glucose/arabinose dehydrogenase
MKRRSLAALALVAAACSGTTGGTTSGTTGGATGGAAGVPAPGGPGSTPSASVGSSSLDACALPRQSPPAGTISANFATALAFAPDGRLFYAERSGTVRVWQGGRSRVFARVSTSTSGERGLLGLAISPTFASDRFVYAFYSNADTVHQEVIRWTDCAGSGRNPTVLVHLPAGNDCCHKGGRLAFGPDGKLYVTLGEEHTSAAAADTSDVRGKVLRYNADGTVPADNPFGADDPVWAAGLRNPFGLAFSASGQLAVTNNGPTGDAGSPSTGYDTVLLSVQRGEIFQWPKCYGYSHVLAPATSCGDTVAPDWSSETQTAIPTGATFVDQGGPAPYAGHLVFCSDGAGMVVVTPGTPHARVSLGPKQCLLDVKEGPDHALYYSDTAHIYRLS